MTIASTQAMRGGPRFRGHHVPLAVACLVGAIVASADAVTIDGTVDPEYGAPVSTQVVQTSFGDTPSDYTPFDPMNQSIGSELDEAYGFVSSGTLYLFFAGNYKSYVGEPLIPPDQLEVFIDCVPGGQNQLRSDNPPIGSYLQLSELAGLTFDSEFFADYFFEGAVEGSGPPRWFFANYAELPAAGGGASHFLGSTSGGSGTLTGGTNPFGVQASINQTNGAGVTAGCQAGSGSGVTTGMEWAIPLAAIGNPSGPIRVSAFIAASYPGVSNQVLGPLPVGTCSLSAPSTVDFGNFAGEQLFTLDVGTPVRRTSWGRLKLSYR